MKTRCFVEDATYPACFELVEGWKAKLVPGELVYFPRSLRFPITSKGLFVFISWGWGHKKYSIELLEQCLHLNHLAWELRWLTVNEYFVSGFPSSVAILSGTSITTWMIESLFEEPFDAVTSDILKMFRNGKSVRVMSLFVSSFAMFSGQWVAGEENRISDESVMSWEFASVLVSTKKIIQLFLLSQCEGINQTDIFTRIKIYTATNNTKVLYHTEVLSHRTNS